MFRTLDAEATDGYYGVILCDGTARQALSPSTSIIPVFNLLSYAPSCPCSCSC